MTKSALRWTALALVVSAMGGAGIPQILAGDFVIDSFDDPATLSCWWMRWGPVQSDWDPAQDTTGGGSGALSVAMSYTNDPAAQNNFGLGRPFCCTCSSFDLTTVDVSLYREVSANVRWDTNSSIGIDAYNSDGELGLTASFWTMTNGLVFLPPVPIPNSASNGWVRMHWPINPATPGIDQVNGFLFKKYDTQTMEGNVRFWVDDITLVSYPCCAPPPAMAIQKASPGLNLFAGSLDPYERENIRTSQSLGSFSWLGHGDAPVSYSFTVTNVDFGATNFQIHLFLIPSPGNETAPDWNEPVAIRVDLWNVGPDNHGQWTLSYKTNNSSYVSIEEQYTRFASLSDSSVLGTWKLTFRNDTQVTMTAPSGASTNFTIPSDVVGYFTDPLFVYFGVQANNQANLGRAATLSSVAILGTANAIYDNFSGPLNPNVWEIIAGYPPGVLVAEPGSWWVKWTIPDAGYLLQTNSVLNNASSWSGSGLPAPITVLGWRQALLPAAMGPGSRQSLFFRMSKSTP